MNHILITIYFLFTLLLCLTVYQLMYNKFIYTNTYIKHDCISFINISYLKFFKKLGFLKNNVL